MTTTIFERSPTMRITTDHGSASFFSGVRTTTLYGHAVLDLIEHDSGIGVDDLQQQLSERPNMKGASAVTVPRSYVEDSLDELLQRGWVEPLGSGYVTTGRLDRESVYKPALTDAVYAAVRSAPEGYRINPDDWTGSLAAVYAISALVEMGAVESRQAGRTSTDTRYFAAESQTMNRITHLLDVWRETAERFTGAPDEFQAALEDKLQRAVFRAVGDFLQQRDGGVDPDDPDVFLPNNWAAEMALDGLGSHFTYGEPRCQTTE